MGRVVTLKPSLSPSPTLSTLDHPLCMLHAVCCKLLHSYQKETALAGVHKAGEEVVHRLLGEANHKLEQRFSEGAANLNNNRWSCNTVHAYNYYTRICMHSICICRYMHIHTCMSTHTHIHTYTHTYVYIVNMH